MRLHLDWAIEQSANLGVASVLWEHRPILASHVPPIVTLASAGVCKPLWHLRGEGGSPYGCSGRPGLTMPQYQSLSGDLGGPMEQVPPGPPDGTVPGGQLLPKWSTKLYRRRWLMLFLFGAVSASNASMWLQFGIIGNIFSSFYDVEPSAVDWLSTVYLLTYVPLVLPVLWLLDTRGVRETVLVGSALNCIGAWVKIGSAHPGMFPVACWGQLLCSVATVFVLGIPSLLASTWFGEHEVSTACSIGVLGNQVCLWRPEPEREACRVLV